MIRFADPRDIAKIRALWDACFADEGGFNDYFFVNIFDVSKTLVLEQNHEICAMLQMLPYGLTDGTRTVQATYIYGACTAPEARRKGYMARLLEHSFSLDRAAGRAASMLIPAEPWLFDFYRPFGYHSCFYVENKTISRKNMQGVLPRRLTVQDIPALSSCYMRQMPPLHVMRNEADWRTQIAMFDSLGQGAYGWFDGAVLTAYAFCWADHAQEAIGLNEQQEQGLLQILKKQSITCTGCGQKQALGCIKRYGGSENSLGYMNLMLN